jgi:hypothetical protein
MKNLTWEIRAGRSRRSFLKGTAALGLTLAVARPALGTTASVVVINENGTVSTSANPAAAKWVSPSAFVASSLETGRIGYIVAWGGNEYGYAYTYALSDAPAGVTIDVDTGILSIASPLFPSAYSFSVRVTNREVVSNVATFPITLTIVQGVTANRTGDQILHKTYDPMSGAYGSTNGNDYTVVLNAIQAAIKADEVAAGEERLRATIIFRRGVQYDYTNNHWLTGLQYFQVTDDPAFPTGAPPILQNINTGTIYENGPLNVGNGGGAINKQDNPPGIKSYCARMNDIAVGATSGTFVTSTDAERIKPGRWHVLMCGQIQLGGFPPNVAYFDYVKIVSVVGSTVTWDRPTRYRYSSTFWEDNDDQAFGRAWLVPWDMGGVGGAVPSDPRLTIRGSFLNINFQPNPNGDAISLLDGFIDVSFENCNVPNPQPTMSKHVLFKYCTTTNGGEPDKIVETLVFDDCATGILGGGTGVQYWLSRYSHHGCIQISPRQFRSLNSLHDGSIGYADLHLPFTISYNGPVMYNHFKGCMFKPGPDSNSWTYHGQPYSPIRIGIDATWSGNRLIIPSGFPLFGDWLNALYEGLILTTTGNPLASSNWGYVANLTSPGNNSAIWADIVWVAGAKPTSGNIYPNGRFRRLNFESDNVFVSPMSWEDPKFMKQTIPPALGPSYGFPTAYPLQYA